MSDGTNDMNNATEGLGDHADGVGDGSNVTVEGADETNTDATNDTIGSSNNIDRDANGDNEANADNGTNIPQNDSISNESPVRQETQPRTVKLIYCRFRQVDKDARCPDCGRFVYDTLLLRSVRPIAELLAQSAGIFDTAQRCQTCQRLWVAYDHHERDIEGDNDPLMVRTELELFADFEQLLSGPATAFVDSLFATNPPLDDHDDEDIYGTSGSDSNEEAESEGSTGDDESDFE